MEKTAFGGTEKAVLEEYFELLRFETVGADPVKLRDCLCCATWLSKWLGKLGFRSEMMQAPGMLGAPPVLFAEREGAEGAPTVLVYGHYDVQPADPLEEWETKPFEPVLKEDGRVYCRGAQDDKGQFFAFLCGMRDFLEKSRGKGAPRIKVLLEGQEESGSNALSRLAPEIAEKLRADVLLVADTGAAEGLRPAIVAGLRGVVQFTLRLEGAKCDLHSGMYGGVAPNPAQGIAELVASLHGENGEVAVRGFCDGMEEPSAEELAAAEASAAGEAALAEEMGCPAEGGEAGVPAVVRNAFRPTIEVNGIHSGYGGPGAKTVIPAAALAKISMRLVPGQNPARAMECVERHLKARTPRGMKLRVEDISGLAAGFRLQMASPVFRLAEDVLREIDPRGPAFVWEGASIPVVSELARASGAAPLLVGWGQAGDRIHSPNESFGAEQFARGRKWGERILAAFAE